MVGRRTVLLGTFGGLLTAICQARAADCSNDAVGSALLDRYVTAINAHDTSSFPELHVENYVQHSGRSANGLAAQIENFRGIFARMPDVRAQVEDRIISGDKVVARMSFAGTHTQPLQGIAP